MYLFELLFQILLDMRAHKLRTFLAIFGIIWGTASIVVLVGLGQGFYASNRASLEAISSGLLFGFANRTTMPYQGLPSGRAITLYAHDVDQLPASFPHIQSSAPYLTHQSLFQYQDKSLNFGLIGTGPTYAAIHFPLTAASRFLTPLDIQATQNTVVLGYKIAEGLFGDTNGLNKTITIDGYPFLVVGIGQASTNLLNNQMSDINAFIPYTTFTKIYGNNSINGFLIQPDNPTHVDMIIRQLQQYFALKFNYSPQDTMAVQIPNNADFTVFLYWFFKGIELFLGFCGFMTLAVGGIGIANTLFLIVSERTPEIGLRMALGAKTYHIITQILLEAVLIVAIGGAIGFACAAGIIGLLHQLPISPSYGQPTLSLSNALSTICILGVIAVLAGYFPAKRAASMQPVEALAF